MILKPLEQWICDNCGEVIEAPEHGWLEWLSETIEPYQQFGFKIVHHQSHSPRKKYGSCYVYDRWSGPELQMDNYLDRFVGPNAISVLLAFVDRGRFIDGNYPGPRVRNLREWAEIVRRLTIPYYEEARLYLGEARYDEQIEGLDADALYAPDTLKGVVKRHRDRI